MMFARYWKVLDQIRTHAKSGNKEDAEQLLQGLLKHSGEMLFEKSQSRLKILHKLCAVYDLKLTFEPEYESCNVDLDHYVNEVVSGVSLVTCCMNRNDNLIKALPSWIACPELNEIIIVDWSSTIPVYDYIRAHGFDDSRIKVIRVDDQPRWILSYAFNIGFRAARFDKILKTDADIILHKEFFHKNTLSDYVFISGDWRIAEKGQEHINGFFYITRKNLMRVKGFNEYITTYGWDDDDIYNRLQASGTKRVHVDVSTIYHIPHDDAQRIGGEGKDLSTGLEQLAQDTLFKIRANRYLAHVMPPWNADRVCHPFKIIGEAPDYLKLQKCGESIHYVPQHIWDDAEYYAALELLSWHAGLRVYDLNKKKLRSLLNAKPLEQITKLDIEVFIHNSYDKIPRNSRNLILKLSNDVLSKPQLQLTAILERIRHQIKQHDMGLVLAATSQKSLVDMLPELASYAYVPAWRDIGEYNSIESGEMIAEMNRAEGKNCLLQLDMAATHALSEEQWDLKEYLPISKPIIKQPIFYIDAQHGLGNRLRAIASAAAIAEASDRKLVIVWQPDHHCDCRFTDLFVKELPLIEESFTASVSGQEFSVYNYMEVEENSSKDAEIILNPGRDVYARSAYVLNSPLTDWDLENKFIRSLKPVSQVRELIAPFDLTNSIGAHVRMEAGEGLDNNTYDNIENWTEEGHELLHYWRDKSHYSHFIRRIDQLMKTDASIKLFLATDMPETYEVFEQYYGNRLSYLKRNVYDRSKEQLIYALADAILLSKCNRLLGSTWSSFSELATRLSTHYSTIEMSGEDF
ncbi:MAG: glycosyltransferase [gamma proteobacterium endosymbiont of Lamellibrachia anaximandri]|nr:glycosyltransferase [gamma proteobacterium endosymbiont of Lamellibrachia anaximandri]MBL3534072.1 glycosyltransferase [gamma proteobacterium endosymbiont of Lamellibrachia anaximandri]